MATIAIFKHSVAIMKTLLLGGANDNHLTV